MNAAYNYEHLRRYPEAAQMYERAVAVAPHDYDIRISRASLPFNARADIGPLRAELEAILAEKPSAAPMISDVLFYCALVQRDSATVSRALTAIPPEGAGGGNFPWPREWFVGLAARVFNDPVTARTSFTAARMILDKIVREQPDYSEAWCLLARVDAGLGNKEEAIREGRRACELLPLSKDAAFGLNKIRALAWTYAWVDETCEQLANCIRLRGYGLTSYGELKLSPFWDPLRGDPRFEKIVADLAPPANSGR